MAAHSEITPVPLDGGDQAIFGSSLAIRRAVALAMRFASTSMPILLVGPTGVGKELFAHRIHAWSRRRGPMVDVNAGALPREMVESLLFGHRKGAFTGANEAAQGLMTAAADGTLFLDELPSLPMEGQAKLLRALDTGEIRALGETEKRTLSCRFIAAAQDDLEARVRGGQFRADLFQRLAGVVVHLPPLVDRPEDIAAIAEGMARHFGRVLGPGVREVLVAHPWPGNARELRSTIERAVHLGTDVDAISVEVVREAIALGAPPVRRDTPGAERAAQWIALCAEHAWDITRAAKSAGVSRATLYRRLRECGITPMALRGAMRTGDPVSVS